jgi:hypothetical protein
MGFLDQMKQGAQRTAWEAERMVRVNKANSAVQDAKREVDQQIMALGRAVLALYDGGTTPPPEATDIYAQIKTQQSRVAQLEQDAERIKTEQPPQGAAPSAAPPASYQAPPQAGYAPPPQAGYAPPPAQGYGAPPDQGYAPPQGGFQPPPGGGYAPTGPSAGYAPTGPGPAAGYAPSDTSAGYAPTGPAAPYAPTGPGGYTPPGPAADQSAAGPATAPSTVCSNCGAPRTDPTAMFCQECGQRYA